MANRSKNIKCHLDGSWQRASPRPAATVMTAARWSTAESAKVPADADGLFITVLVITQTCPTTAAGLSCSVAPPLGRDHLAPAWGAADTPAMTGDD